MAGTSEATSLSEESATAIRASWGRGEEGRRGEKGGGGRGGGEKLISK